MQQQHYQSLLESHFTCQHRFEYLPNDRWFRIIYSIISPTIDKASSIVFPLFPLYRTSDNTLIRVRALCRLSLALHIPATWSFLTRKAEVAPSLAMEIREMKKWDVIEEYFNDFSYFFQLVSTANFASPSADPTLGRAFYVSHLTRGFD